VLAQEANLAPVADERVLRQVNRHLVALQLVEAEQKVDALALHYWELMSEGRECER
jgi:hypothetical protein